MNPFKSPHQLLLEEAGASLDPSPGLVNTPQQMLMQQANVLPHFAPGGSVNSMEAPSSLPDVSFSARSMPNMTGMPGVGYMQTPQGAMARMQLEKELENKARLRAGVSGMGMAPPGQHGVKLMPGQMDIGANVPVGPGNLDISANRSINPIPGKGHMQMANVRYTIPFAIGGQVQNLSPADMQASLIVNGQTPRHFATGGFNQPLDPHFQNIINKASRHNFEKMMQEENPEPVFQAQPDANTYSTKARDAFAKGLSKLTGNERWSEETTNDLFGTGYQEPWTLQNAVPNAVKTAVQFLNPVSTTTGIMDAPHEASEQAREGNYLGAGLVTGLTAATALPYFKPAKKLIDKFKK